MTALTEDGVIDAVIDFLKSERWELLSRANARQRGHDIVAARDGRRLFVEAKGAGSSKPGTSRYGREFNKGQVFDHVAKAILKALRVVADAEARAAVAFPDNEDHRKEVSKVHQALQELGIAVFWVSSDGRVKVEWAEKGRDGERRRVRT